MWSGVVGAKRRWSDQVGSVSPHGSTLELDAVGVMHEPIEDGVAEGGIADDVMPVIDGKLAGNECSALSVSVLEHFEQIPAFGLG